MFRCDMVLKMSTPRCHDQNEAHHSDFPLGRQFKNADGQVPNDKTSVDETKFSTTSFRKLEALSPFATELTSTVSRS